MSVEPTHAPLAQALTPMTQQALDALLRFRVGGTSDPDLEADFSHEVWHDVDEGRYSEGEAKALLQAYACPVPDTRGEEGKKHRDRRAEPAPKHEPPKAKAKDDDDDKDDKKAPAHAAPKKP